MGPDLLTREWREPIAPLRVLAGCGWLDPLRAHDPNVRLESLSSAHDVVKVVDGEGRAAVVKQVPVSAARMGRSLRQELFVYRLARWVPEVAVSLPAPIHLDEAQQVLVVAAVDGAERWPVTRLERPDVAGRLGALMAGWHRATQRIGLWTSPAMGVLELPDALDVASRDRAPETRRLMASIAADRVLATSLRNTGRSWQDRCLIHGDIRRENVMAAPTTDAAVTVIDWELSGSGDPRWDVGSVLADAVIARVRDGDATGWPPDEPREAGLRAFVRAYVAAGGLPTDERDWDVDAWWGQVAACAAARLLHVACEWSETWVEGQDQSWAPLVSDARTLYRAPVEVGRLLDRWARA